MDFARNPAEVSSPQRERLALSTLHSRKAPPAMSSILASDQLAQLALPRESDTAHVASEPEVALASVSPTSQAGLLKPRGAAGARADEKEVTTVYCRPFCEPWAGNSFARFKQPLPTVGP